MKRFTCFFLWLILCGAADSSPVRESTVDAYLQERQQIMFLPYAEIIPALEQASFDTTTTLGRYFYYSIWLNVGQGKSSVTLTPADLQKLEVRYPALFLENNILATWFSDQPSQTRLLALYQLKQNAANQNWARLRRLASYYLVKTYQGEGSYLNAIIELHNVMKIAPPATAGYDWYDFPLTEMYKSMAFSMFGLENDTGRLKYCTKLTELTYANPRLSPDFLANALSCQVAAFLGLKQYDEATLILKQLSRVARESKDSYIKVVSLLRFATFYREKGNYSLSFKYAQEIIEFQKQINVVFPDMTYNAYMLMSLATLEQQKTESAMHFFQLMKNSKNPNELGSVERTELLALNARLQLANRKYEDAFNLYQRAVDKITDHTDAPVKRLHLNMLSEELKNPERNVLATKHQLHQTRAEQMTLIAVFTTALVIVSGALIWYLMRHKQQLEAFARTDSLTRLYNRGYCMSLAEKLLETASPDKPVCLALIDIDHFKQINDRYGHQTGDKVLTDFGKQLHQWCGKNYLAGRYGGEEFLLILPDTTLESAQKALDKLRQRLQDAGADTPAITGPVTFSGGLVQASQPAVTDTVIGMCDILLYQAKAYGRNRVCSRKLHQD